MGNFEITNKTLTVAVVVDINNRAKVTLDSATLEGVPTANHITQVRCIVMTTDGRAHTSHYTYLDVSS